MKAKRVVILGMIVLVLAGLWVVGGAASDPRAGSESEVVAPMQVSYQGQVSVEGEPYDGSGYFKFAIVDADGSESYWSSDGTSVGGSEPSSAVELAVSGGLFDVLLGDTSLPNMTQPLTPEVFAAPVRHLRVWFSADGAGYTLLSPDRAIASAPYALQAQEAANAAALGGHPAEEVVLPTGTMVLGAAADDPGLIAAGFTSTGQTIQPEAWSYRAPMPTARQVGFAVVAVDGIIYAIGGEANKSIPLNTIEAYDPATDSWSTRAPMPTARNRLAAAVADGVIYAIGGQNEYSRLDTVEAYDPATDSWSTKSPMPTARGGLAAAAVDGIVYAIGGWGAEGELNTVEAYDPDTDSWSSKTSMPTGRSQLAAAALHGILYAIGGYGGQAALEAYDPATNSWSFRAPMQTSRSMLAAAVANGLIYAIGGYTGLDIVDTVEAYDPASDSWTALPSMLHERAQFGAAVVDSVLYAVGDYYSRSVEAYTPAPLLYLYRKE